MALFKKSIKSYNIKSNSGMYCLDVSGSLTSASYLETDINSFKNITANTFSRTLAKISNFVSDIFAPQARPAYAFVA